jgi:hypothetical protein
MSHVGGVPEPAPAPTKARPEIGSTSMANVIQNWLDSIMSIGSWTTLRSIGNSRLVQASVAFPFVGYVILFNGDVARFLGMDAIDHRDFTNVFDWLWRQKLFFMYFGLMALGIGSTIYQIRCPYFVKKYGDWADFINGDGESYSYSYLRELGTAVGITYPEDYTEKESGSVGSEIMQAWYERQSLDLPVARFFVSLFFVTGFALLAVPSTLTAIKVIGIAFR